MYLPGFGGKTGALVSVLSIVLIGSTVMFSKQDYKDYNC